MTRKLPYIPDKKLYAAVMGACSYIRTTGYFNKAVRYYADKYNVSVDDVIRYVRIAQGNGQRMSTKKRKYHWFAVEYSNIEHINYFEEMYAQYVVVKATSEDNAMNRVYKHYGENVMESWLSFGRIERCDTEDDAVRCCERWEQNHEH